MWALGGDRPHRPVFVSAPAAVALVTIPKVKSAAWWSAKYNSNNNNYTSSCNRETSAGQWSLMVTTQHKLKPSSDAPQVVSV